jgi:hypothetical protein
MTMFAHPQSSRSLRSSREIILAHAKTAKIAKGYVL